MGIFEPVTITWKGTDYTVQPDKVMMLIAKIEDIITFSELVAENPKLVKLAMAFGAALRYAGAKVTDDEIYASLFKEEGMGAADAVSSLILMMMPPEILTKGNDGEKKDQASQ